MGTRSNIAYEQPNGEVIITYCHWDGYPTYNGQVLNDHYNNPKKAEEIANQGYLSSLRETVALSIEDRAHLDQPFMYSSVEAYINDISFDIEYAYIFTRGQWYCNEYNLCVSDKTELSSFEPLWSVLVKHKNVKESA